jgi:hypothetical protein
LEDGTPVALRFLVDSSSPGGMPVINCNLPKRIRGTNQVDVDVVNPFEWSAQEKLVANPSHVAAVGVWVPPVPMRVCMCVNM